MLVVLEGCDGAGKSTLARSLAEILDAEIVHCSSKTPNDYEFFKSIVDASRQRNIIADRFCYGQFVYQQAGERPLGSTINLNNLELELLHAGAKIIHVVAPVEDVEGRLKTRGEKPINGLTVEEVIKRFRNVFKNDSILSNSVIEWYTGSRWR